MTRKARTVTDLTIASVARAQNVDTVIAEIAKKHLYLETLKAGNSDDLDFHEHSVWSIEAALKAAFEAGRNSK